MKSIRYIIVCLYTFVSFIVMGQEASIGNEMKIFSDNYEWPICSDPQDIKWVMAAHEVEIRWTNQNTEGNYFFEIGMFNENNESPSMVFESKSNSILLDNAYFESRDKVVVKIRRICMDKKLNKYVSDWVLASPIADCSGGSVSATASAICSGTIPNILFNNTNAGLGANNYQWQYSNASTNNQWISVPSNGNASTYTANFPISSNTSYRRYKLCGAYSNSVVINVSSTTVNPGSITANQTTICSGNTVSFTSSAATATSGTITYKWQSRPNTSSDFTDITGVTTQNYTATNISANIIFRRLAKSNACTTWSPSNEVSINVNQSPIANISIVNGSNPLCSGNSITLTASGGGTYLWANGLGTSATIVSSPTSSTSYIVTVTSSSNACTSTSQLTVNVNNSPTGSISLLNGSNPFCSGASVTMIAAGGNNYQWSNGSTSSINTVSLSSSVSYTVTATANNGCSNVAVQNFVVNNTPIASITGNNSICPNQSITLTGSGGSSFLWSTGATTPEIQVNSPDTYILTVTSNGCNSSTSYTVAQSNNCCQFGFEYLVQTTPNTGSCPFSYKLSGSFSITNPVAGAIVKIKEVNSGAYVEKTLQTGIYSYAFEINDILYTGNNYKVEFSMNTYCSGIPPITEYTHSFTAPPGPIIDRPSTICEGVPVTLTILNPPSNASYIWNTGATTSSISITPYAAFEYKVTITSSCVYNLSTVVIPESKPFVSITSLSSVCSGGNIVLESTTASAYNWNNGQSTKSIDVSPTSSTTYQVTITDSHGCTNSASKYIEVINCACTIGTISSLNVGSCNGYGLYSISGTIQVDNPLSGESITIKDYPSNIQITIPLVTGVFIYNYELVDIPGQQTNPHIKVFQSNCQQVLSQNYTPPSNCGAPSCQIIGINLSPMTCSNNLYSASGSISISNYNVGQQVEVSIKQNENVIASVILNYPDVQFNFANLMANGLYSICTATMSQCSLSSGYTAPIPCSQSYGIEITNTNCDPNSNTHDIDCTINISNPVPGLLAKWTHSYGINGDFVLTSANTYNIKVKNIPSNGTTATLTLLPIPNVCPSFAESYEAPASCTTPNCVINSLDGVPGSCHLNKYSLAGTVILVSPVAQIGETLTVTDSPGNKTYTFTVENKSTYNYVIDEINADGLEHTISINGSCGSKTIKYKAPASCSSLPQYECGQPYQVPTLSTVPSLTSLNTGDVIYSAGLGVEVTSVSSSGATFSGEGLLAHPFPGLPLKVTFSGISINNLYQVTNGNIEGVRDQLAENFNVPQGTIHFGGEICETEAQANGEDEDGFDSVTGLNSRGFNRDSLYQPGNQKFDPKGFDFSGNHKDTGTPYDSFGCNMEGYDSSGNPCKSDSLLTQKRDSIINIINTPPFLNNAIDNIIDKLTDTLLTFNCSAIRSTINNNISALNYAGDDTLFIKGKDALYFKDGMSSHFSEDPKVLLNNSNREALSIELEANHVKLFACDKFRQKYQSLLDGMQGLDIDKLKKYIKDEINRLSSEEIGKLKEGGNFEKWLIEVITDYIESGQYGSIELNTNRNSNYTSYDSPFNSIAGLENFQPRAVKKGVEEAWLFNQGFKNIKGVSRGFYLDEVFNQRRLDLNPPSDGQYLPIPLIKDTLDASFRIFIDNIVLKPDGAKLDAYFIYDDQNSDQRFVMEAHNLNWGAGGLIGDVSLKLLSTVELKLCNSAMLIINPVTNATNGSYVTWDCKGYKKMQLDASIELCRELVVPLDPVTYEPMPLDVNYRFDFLLSIAKLNEIYLEINGAGAKPFAIAKHEDTKWLVSKLVLDFSDSQSPKNVQMFSEYKSPHYDGSGFNENWKGVYIGEVSVRLPNSFSSNNTQPMTIGAKNIVIDDKGVSGKAYGANIVDIKNGSLGGWPYSLDTFSIIALHSRLIGGGIVGKLQVPIFKKPMRYKAQFKPDNIFEFIISPSASEEIDMLLATAKLDSNSFVSMKIIDGKVEAVADLTGVMKIGALGGSKVSIDIPDIRFKNLRVSNLEPYFDSGDWKVDGGFGAKLLGFEISIDKILPIQEEKTVTGVAFNVALSLPMNLKAGGGLEVIGHMEYDDQQRQRWVYETTKINSFSISATFSGGYFKGSLQTFDESNGSGIYGKGFQGSIELGLNNIGEFKAMGLFGKSGGTSPGAFKYFFVDASAKLSNGIPLGPIEINGFVGGVSYKMNTAHNGTPIYSGTNPVLLPPIGQSFSGITYTPDKTKSLGLRAGALFKFVANESTFNGVISFDFLFNAVNEDGTGGGLAKFGITGVAQLMSKKPINGGSESKRGKKPSQVSSPLSINLRIEFNVNEGYLHGDLETYLSLSVFEGIGKDSLGNNNNKMVDASLVIDKDKWYFYFGTPDSRCGIRANLGIIKAELSAYLDIGSVVPNMPPLPQKVRAIASAVYQNQALRTNGAGFTMGASFDIKASLDLGIAKGEVAAGLGFDVMIRDFGDAKCSGSNEKIGINGWYAMGQMWAYVEGSVTFLGINIIKAGVAAVLQAQLPNPTFAQATVGVKIKTFLTGEMHKNMSIKFGTPCNIIEDGKTSPLGMKVIGTINPIDGSKNVLTDVRPTIAFNVAMDQTTTIGPDKFDVKLDQLTFKSLKSNRIYEVNRNYNDDHVLLNVDPQEVFQGNDSIQMIVKVSVKKNNGQPLYEADTAIFTTGASFDKIPSSNVESSYPVDGMHNFFIHENKQYQGFIQLKSGMPAIFYNIPEDKTQKLRLTDNTGKTTDIAYNYDGLNARINFSIDPDFFEKNKVYKLQMIRMLSSDDLGNASADQGIDISEASSNVDLKSALGSKNPLNTESNSKAGNSGIEVLYEMYFRTSIYNTFKDKLNTASKNGKKIVIAGEPFDNIEKESLVSVKYDQYNGLEDIVAKLYEGNYPLNIHYEYEEGTPGSPEKDCFVYHPDTAYQEKINDIEIINQEMQIISNQQFTSSYTNTNSGNMSFDVISKIDEDLSWVRKQINDCNKSAIKEVKSPPNSSNIVKYYPSQTDYEAPLGDIRNNNYSFPPSQIGLTITYKIPGLGTTSTINKKF